MTEDWTASIAAERMELDQEFADRVEASSFDRQQWGLVMTALEFDVEDPDDPETARIVPDTSNLGAIMPELDNVSRGGPMAQGQDGGGTGGGLLDAVKGAFGVGDGGDDERREEAEELAAAYASQLQEKLVANGRWDDVLKRARN